LQKKQHLIIFVAACFPNSTITNAHLVNSELQNCFLKSLWLLALLTPAKFVCSASAAQVQHIFIFLCLSISHSAKFCASCVCTKIDEFVLTTVFNYN